MKRLLSLLLCCALLLSPALAAEYPDLDSGHWAYEAMDGAHSLGILTGHLDGSMDPAGTLTWGQFLTMLGRAFYRDRLEAQPAGSHWASASYQAALEAGALRPEDPLSITEQALDTPLSRQDAVLLLVRLPSELPAAEPARDAAAAFSDYAILTPHHRDALDTAYGLGLVTGRTDGSFSGDDPLTRAEGATLLMRALAPAETEAPGEADPEETDPGAETPAEAPLTQEEALALVSRGELSWEDYEFQDFWLKELGENRRKCLLLFGDPDQRRFASQEEAQAHMSEITVPVWRLNTATGEKTAGEHTLTVHAAIAEEVLAAFTEIFNDPEQFPIKNLGGYNWRGDSSKGEHNCGTAIDINWEENYQIYDNGRVGAGSHWKPGEDPFSIPEEGSVVRIFAAHGFAWGGNAWSGSKDYMHVSYMGK